MQNIKKIVKFNNFDEFLKAIYKQLIRVGYTETQSLNWPDKKRWFHSYLVLQAVAF